MTSVDEFLGRLRGARKSGNGWSARCPAHDDRKASLSISVVEKETKILVHCHAGCSLQEICSAVGIEVRELFLDDDRRGTRSSRGGKKPAATYNYLNEGGSLLFQVCRFKPKDFRQRRPDGKGGWISNLEGVRRVLYRLPEIVNSDNVLVVEGEKDAETARALELVATCNPGGAGKWHQEYTDTLAGKEIIIIPDADEPGRRHAQQIAAALASKARSLKLVELPGAKDLSQWVEQGGTRQQLLDLLNSAPSWVPQPVPNGRDLLREVEQFISSFVILPVHALLPLTLWVIATHVFNIFDAFPLMILSSPAPRCGKTRTLEILELLVARPKKTANVSEAALFRLADSAHPTFLLDEQETLSGKSERAEAIRGLLNAGHRRGQTATRCVGSNRDEVREFDVYCPKVLAGIGDFPATLRDRGVVVVMQRRQLSQSVARFVHRVAFRVATDLKAKLERFISTNSERIRTTYERAPSVQFLSDREEENWTPLFCVLAITDPSRASDLQADAEALSRRKAETDDEQTLALEVARHAVEVWPPNDPSITTKKLIELLQSKEDAPTFKRDGVRPELELSPHRLARMIRGFGVRPINIRLKEGSVRKGYRRSELETALSPYLPVLSATSATDLTNQEVARDFRSATQVPVAGACLPATPREENHVAAVAGETALEDEGHDFCQISEVSASGVPSRGCYRPEPQLDGSWRCECGAIITSAIDWSRHTGVGGCPLKVRT